MATASSYRTAALGSIDEPMVVQRRGLPTPSAIMSPMGAGSMHPPLPKKTYGMDYSGKYTTGPANYQPGRTKSVGQVMAGRTGAQAARYDDGTPVPKGMPINVAGFNTSGVGPGTRGYRGSGRIGSAAGAVGSSGVPTSQRGKLMKYGEDALDEYGQMRTTDDISDELLDLNGLSQSWRYSDMGAPPIRRYTNTNPLQTQSVRSPQPGAVSAQMGMVTGPMKRMGDMISKYLTNSIR
jgi:hypothetical protein